MPALEHKQRVDLTAYIRNADRTVGTMLGSEVTRRQASNVGARTRPHYVHRLGR